MTGTAGRKGIRAVRSDRAPIVAPAAGGETVVGAAQPRGVSVAESWLAEGRRGDLLAVGLTLAAAGIRLFNLDGQALWLDECTSYLNAGLPAVSIWNMGDGLPPLYELLLHVLRGFGLDSDWWLRLPSALAGAMTVGLVYLIGRRIGDRSTGVVAAALLAVNPLAVWYAQEARAYSLLTCCAVGATLSLLAIRDQGGVRSVFAYAAWNTIGFGLHYYYAFTLLAHAGVIAFDVLRNRARRSRWLMAAALTALGMLVWVPGLLHDIAAQSAMDEGRPESRLAFLYTVLTFVGGFSLGPSLRQLHADAWLGVPAWEHVAQHLVVVSMAIGLLLTLVVIAGIRRMTVSWCLVLLMMIVPILGPWLASSVVGFRPRYALPGLPFVLLWVAGGIHGRFARLALPMLVLLGALGVTGVTAMNRPEYAREDARSAAHWLGERAGRGVAFMLGETASPFTRYATADPKLRQVEAHEVQDFADMRARLGEIPLDEDVFLVSSRPWTVDRDGRVQALLDERFALREQAAFAGVTVRWYAPQPAPNPPGP